MSLELPLALKLWEVINSSINHTVISLRIIFIFLGGIFCFTERLFQILQYFSLRQYPQSYSSMRVLIPPISRSLYLMSEVIIFHRTDFQ